VAARARGRRPVVRWTALPLPRFGAAAGSRERVRRFRAYRPSGPGGRHEPFSLQVVEISGGRISRFTFYLEPQLPGVRSADAIAVSTGRLAG
jgi:hypothetical protein